MSKHKIIHKIIQRTRPKENDQNSDSSNDQTFQLHEVDCNNSFLHPKQTSILDFIDSLKYYSHREIIQEEEYQQNYTACNSMSFSAFNDLQKINARYMSMLGNFQPSNTLTVPTKTTRVRFDIQVKAKYFSSEGMVCEIFDAEQYTSYEQYQQTQDEKREPSPN